MNEIGLITELDKLSWGFKIDKWCERECPATYKVLYVDPTTKIWSEVHGDNLPKILLQIIKAIEENKCQT